MFAHPSGIRPAFRALRHSPAFTVTAILTLGLGLGFHLLFFNILNALFWRPLPFPEAGRLVILRHQEPGQPVFGSATGLDHALMREGGVPLSAMGLAQGRVGRLDLVDGGRHVELRGVAASAGYFRALGIRPRLGRLFGEEEDRGDAGERRALISEGVWRRDFGGDPSILGRVVQIASQGEIGPLRILGVLPGGVTLPLLPDAELVLSLPVGSAEIRGNGGDALYRLIGRLAPGVTLAEASVRTMSVIQAGDQRPWTQRVRFRLEPLRDVLAPAGRQGLFWLAGGASLLLLLTCANVAGLFLARALDKERESALRAALGASLSQVLREHFREALMVCGAGSVLALGLVAMAKPILLFFLPELKEVGAESLDLGPGLLTFSLLSCLLSAFLMVALPVLQTYRIDLGRTLTSGGRTGTTRLNPWRAGLIVAQMSVVLVLLTVSGLAGRSFLNALDQDPGFRPRGVLAFGMIPPIPAEAMGAKVDELERTLGALPGVRSVGVSSESMMGRGFCCTFRAGKGNFEAGDPDVAFRMVSAGMLPTLGARVVEGRLLTAAETRGGQPVAVLNEAAARLLYPGCSPVNREVRSGIGGRVWTVVGVVKDLRLEGLDRPAGPMAFLPYQPFGEALEVMVRTDGSVQALASLVRDRIATPGARLHDFRSLVSDLSESLKLRQRSVVLLGLFALLGLVVGCLGLYGTLSGQVTLRGRELGIRMALGAGFPGLVRLVLGQGARLVILGGVVGSLLSVGAARLMRGELYGIGPFDVPAFSVALLVLSAAALLACLLPALRAARVHPAEALRRE